jgi:hypothetical protein
MLFVRHAKEDRGILHSPLPPWILANKVSTVMHATAFAASAAQSCNPSTNQGSFSVEHSLKLQLQCDTSTCKLPPSLQRAFNCLCGAKRWLGVSFSDACLHCRAAASWPRSCRHYRCTWLTLPLEGIYIEIDLHCMCTVSRHTF